MRLRFQRTTPSASPGFPFQAGQVINATRLTPEMHRWIADGAAIVLPEGSERADMPGGERAVTTRARGVRA